MKSIYLLEFRNRARTDAEWYTATQIEPTLSLAAAEKKRSKRQKEQPAYDWRVAEFRRAER